MDKDKHSTILVIDDEPEAREVLPLIFGQRDDVRFAVDEDQALILVKQEPPDAIFVDLWIGEVSAFDLYQRLKADLALEVQVVFYGTEPEDVIFPRARSLGVAGYVFIYRKGPIGLVHARDAVLRGDVYYPSGSSLAKRIVKFLGITRG